MIETVQRNGKIILKTIESKICNVKIVKKESTGTLYEFKKTEYLNGLVKEYMPLEICTEKPLRLVETFPTKR